MLTRRKSWLWVEAAVSAVVGIMLVLRESAVGWVFIVLGLIYVGLLVSPGWGRNISARLLRRWGLIALIVLAVALILFIGWRFLRL